jgi:hypothetical protein
MSLCAPGRHLPVLTVSRPARTLFLRRLYHVRCWECDLDLTSRDRAQAHAQYARVLRSAGLV